MTSEVVSVPIPRGRALRLILGLRIRETRNEIGRLAVSRESETLSAKPRRGRVLARGSAVAVLLTLLLLAFAFGASLGITKALAGHLVAIGVTPRAFASLARNAREYAAGIAFFLDGALLVALCLGLGVREPQRLGVRVESLLALPVSLTLAFVAEIAERAIVNPFVWLGSFPLLTVALGAWGRGYWSPILAALLTVLHGITVASLEFTIAILSRRRLGPAGLGNLRAACLAIGMLLPVAFSPFLMDLLQAENDPSGSHLSQVLLRVLSPFALMTPGGAGLLLAQGTRPERLGLGTWLPLVGLAGTWVVTIALLARASARGMDAVVSVAGARGPAARPSPVLRLLRGTLAEELLAVSRDKAMLTMQVLVPLAAVVINTWVMPAELRTPASLGVGCVLLGTMIAGGAATVLPRMGPSVWLLYTVARPVERVVFERAAVWGASGTGAALVALLVLFQQSLARPGDLAGPVTAALLGIPALALASAAVGILGADPLAAEPHRRLRPEENVQILVFTIGVCASALVPDGRGRMLLLGLLVAIAAALWQRARAHLPFVLDPGAIGVRPIDAADGLKAVVCFFGLQILLGMALSQASLGTKPMPEAWVVTLSFFLAGFFTLGLTIDPLVKQCLPLREIVPLRAREGTLTRLLAGAALGVVCFVLALGYIALLQHQLGHAIPESWVPRVVTETFRNPYARILIPVILAPVIEEIVFRALLYRGIRASMGPRPAVVLSAAIFALVHPELGFGAVFALGAGCAWIFETTGLISAAMLTHAVYNAGMVLAR
jgi:ABC-2 type transport system permease protein